MKRPNPRAEQGKVDAFNAVHAVGVEVDVRLDNGKTIRARTTAPASLLGGHTAVVWIDGISGAYLLSRCTAVRQKGVAE